MTLVELISLHQKWNSVCNVKRKNKLWLLFSSILSLSLTSHTQDPFVFLNDNLFFSTVL